MTFFIMQFEYWPFRNLIILPIARSLTPFRRRLIQDSELSIHTLVALVARFSLSLS